MCKGTLVRRRRSSLRAVPGGSELKLTLAAQEAMQQCWVLLQSIGSHVACAECKAPRLFPISSLDESDLGKHAAVGSFYWEHPVTH